MQAILGYFLNLTPTFEWCMVQCGSKHRHKKRHHEFKRDWTPCSKFVNHSRLTSPHSWGDLYDHLMTSRIFTLIMKRITTWASRLMRKMETATIWICQSSHTKTSGPNLVSHLKQTPIFECCVVRCESIYLKESGLCAQNLLTILSSRVINIIWGTYMTI